MKIKYFAVIILLFLMSGCGRKEENISDETDVYSSLQQVQETIQSQPSTKEEPNETIQEEEMADYPAMIMVDGMLYYDSGEISSMLRCGLMEGEITDSIDTVPKKDNQSNFGTGYGYQYGVENQIDVCIDDEWHIFIPYNTAEKADNESDTSDTDTSDTLSQYVGTWQIDGIKTEEQLQQYGSLQEMFGTGIGSYGSNITIEEDGAFEYYIGIGIGGTGQCEVKEEMLTVEVTPYEDHGEGVQTLTVVAKQEGEVQYLVTEFDNEQLYWHRAE